MIKSTKNIFLLLVIIILTFGCQNSANEEEEIKCNEDNEDYSTEQWYFEPNDGSTIDYGLDIVDQPTDFEVNVAIVLDGLDSRHCEFEEQLNSDLNWNFYNRSLSSILADEYMKRGTLMAGLIAAKDDGIGITGVAPESKIAFFNLTNARSPENEGISMNRSASSYDISVNTWATEPDDEGLINNTNQWEEGIKSVIGESGFNNTDGVIYLFGAGSSGRITETGYSRRDTNLNNYTNYHYVLTICSITSSGDVVDYHVTGANLLVCGPSIGSKTIISTDVLGEGGYNGDLVINDFTDAYNEHYPSDISTALVGGVSAAIRSVRSTDPLTNNNRLSWRDIRLILAESATATDLSDESWVEGNIKKQDRTQKYRHSEKYGFGLVNMKKAIEVASTWSTIANTTYSSIEFVGEGGESENDMPITSVIEVDSDEIETTVTAIEYIEITIDSFEEGDLNNSIIELISSEELIPPNVYPSMTSTLMSEEVALSLTQEDSEFKFPISWRFGAIRDLGRSPFGSWTLKITPVTTGFTPKIRQWKIKFWGRVGL